MPYYMDRHDLAGVTAADIAAAHVMDLEAQDRYGVNYITYWFDPERQHAFCLANGPDREAVEAVHRESHGLVANQVIEVDETAVGRFLGDIVGHPAGEPYVATAFRAIMFTDLEGSTRLTQTLGDTQAMEVLSRHNEIAREALGRTGGREVKHTGDGIMASFASVSGAIEAAVQIQRALAEAGAAGKMPIGVRIGIAAGEPVTERDDLFGAAVQLAARLTARAKPHSILVSSAVRDLAHGKSFRFEPARTFRLKGFDGPVSAAEVIWRQEAVEPVA
jgi:class 3 adenylate cyclase